MERIELILNGLGCANCADKIEKKLSQHPELKDVSLNFVSKKLRFKAKKGTDRQELIGIIQKIASSVEDGIKVVEEADDEHENENLRVMLIQIIISALFFILSIIVENKTTSFLLVFSSYIIVGYEVIISAIKNILKGKALDESFLMTIATAGAFIIGEYTEGVAVMLFYQTGEFFQHLAVNRSRKSITELMDIRPDYANLKTGNSTERVSPDKVSTGDVIVIQPGEKIPLDGRVLNGNSSIDTSALTGESLPREISPEDEVLSGSINLTGVIEVVVTKPFSESTVSKILHLVSNASAKKAVAEKFITRFARVYTPIVVAVAVVIALLPPIILEGATFSQWLYRALIFLVVSCPCALVISVPLSFFGGIGGASRSGILIKGASSLEALSKADMVAFDKTGTLTKGKFSISEIKASNISQHELLETAAHIESFSSHPVARAIIEGFNGNIDKDRVSQLSEIAGKGVRGIFDNKEILIGNSRLLQDNNISSFKVSDRDITTVYIAIDGSFAGRIEVSDTVRKGSKPTVSGLKQLGITRIVMLTGDKKPTGLSIASKLGINEAYTELLPQDKVETVEKLLKEKADGKTLVFVGDGINDAPVLARADVGIAMGGLGADSAVEASDIVLMTDEPERILSAIKISRKTMRIVRENIVFALGVKLLVLILGSLGYASMWMAVFADVGVSLIAILNALRALKKVR